MYAIIETGGKQLRVEEGQQIWVEKLSGEVGDEIVFDKVVVLGGEKLSVGNPYVAGATVKAQIEKQGKEKKITIFKYVSKQGSTRRKKGHRQPYTRLLVQSING